MGIFSKKLTLGAGLATTFGAVALSGVVAPASAAPCSSPYVKGDVFASVGSGVVDVFTPTGVAVCRLDDGTGLPSRPDRVSTKPGTSTSPTLAGGHCEVQQLGGLVAGTFMAPGAEARLNR